MLINKKKVKACVGAGTCNPAWLPAQVAQEEKYDFFFPLALTVMEQSLPG